MAGVTNEPGRGSAERTLPAEPAGPRAVAPVGRADFGPHGESMEEVADYQRRLQAVTDAALADLSLDALLAQTLERIGDVLAADTITVLLVDEAGAVLVPRAARGIEEELAAAIRIPVGQGFAGRIAAEGRPRILNEIRPNDVISPVIRAKGVRSLLGVPLTVTGRSLGVLHIGSFHPRHFTSRDVHLIQAVAGRVALAIDRARLYAAEQQAREEAEAAVRVRDQFLAAITHDLGQPLTMLRALAQLGRRCVQASAGGTVAEAEAAALDGYLAEIEGATTAMTAMVRELVDLARLQSGRDLDLVFQPTDLVALVRREIDSQQRTTSRHQIRLESASVDLTGGWDRGRIQRVVQNLIGNAVKYSPNGGEIAVTIKPEAEGNRTWATLTVEDHGIGIPAEDLPHLFERFHRGSNTAGQIAGTGIGLSSAKQIVEQHGGVITIESIEGEMTRVTVRLPLD